MSSVTVTDGVIQVVTITDGDNVVTINTSENIVNVSDGIKGDKGDSFDGFLENITEPSPPVDGTTIFSEGDDFKSIGTLGGVTTIAEDSANDRNLPQEINFNSSTGLISGGIITNNSTDISTIQGDGVDTITVVTSVAHGYVGAEVINIAGTVNYDETGVTVVFVSATSFTYTTAILSTALEVVGTVGSVLLYDTSAGEVTFAIPDGTGKVIRDPIKFLATKANVNDFIFTDANTYISVTDSGGISTSPDIPNSVDRIHSVLLGKIVHAVAGVVHIISDLPVPSYGVGNTLIDVLYTLRGIKIEGYEITPNGANMNINVSPGSTTYPGQVFHTNVESPSTSPPSPATSPQPFGQMLTHFLDADDEVKVGVFDNLVHPDTYNPQDGTLQDVPTGRYTAQRVFVFGNSGGLNLAFGRSTYVSLNDAVNGWRSESYKEHPDTWQGAHAGTLIVQEGTTNLEAAFAFGKAKFIAAGSLREGNWHGGSVIDIPESIGGTLINDADQPIVSINTPQRIGFNLQSPGFEDVIHDPVKRNFDIIIATAGTYIITPSVTAEKNGGGASAQELHIFARKGNNDNGVISSVAVSSPAEVTTSSPHNLTTGQTVDVEDVVTTPDINGEQLITVTGASTYTIDGINTTVVTDGTGLYTRLLDSNDDVDNSNAEVISDSSSFAATLTRSFSLFAEEGEKINGMVSSTSTAFSLESKTPAGEPSIASAVVTINKTSNI